MGKMSLSNICRFGLFLVCVDTTKLTVKSLETAEHTELMKPSKASATLKIFDNPPTKTKVPTIDENEEYASKGPYSIPLQLNFIRVKLYSRAASPAN